MAPPAAPRHWSEAVNWIWVPHYDDIERVGGIVLFRKTFHLVDIPSSCIVNVSADSRYRLFVNGTSVSFGPAKSHLGEWNYESIDIASFLKAGQNIICARVLRYSPRHSGNLSLIRATIPGFILHTSDLVSVHAKGYPPCALCLEYMLMFRRIRLKTYLRILLGVVVTMIPSLFAQQMLGTGVWDHHCFLLTRRLTGARRRGIGPPLTLTTPHGRTQ